MRWICGAKWDRKLFRWTLHHEDCRSRVGLPTIEQRHYLLSCCQIYKIVKSQDCLRFSDYFTFNSSITRTESFRLNVLPSRINSYRYSFFINAPFLWNDISPDIITNSSSLLVFKQKLTRHHYIILFVEYIDILGVSAMTCYTSTADTNELINSTL